MPNFEFTGFVSLYFAFFLVGSLLIYWLFPKKIRLYTLLVFNIVFYCLISWKSIFFLLYSVVLNFFIAFFIEKIKKKEALYLEEHKENITKEEKKAYKAKNKKIRKLILIIGIILNVAILVVMKYLNFIVWNVNSLLELFGNGYRFPVNHWFLPLGISFYTFQAIGYIVDIYWGKYEAEKNFFKFAIFMTYFPKIMQGPIIRYNETKEALFSEKTFDYVTFTNGAKRMMYGYLKKMVIADTLMVFVTFAFDHDNIALLSGLEAFFAVVIYFIQDYADFSGYMDISIGISDMMGIEMPENFRRPYFAIGIDDYWRRWHITLGTWFKDYIYYPLSISKFSLFLGKKSKKVFGSWGMKVPAIFGLILVWFLTGLWHGASWNYVFWGLYFGVIIILGICFEPLFDAIYAKLHINKNNGWLIALRHIRTLLLLAIGKVIFITGSLSDAWLIVSKMFRFDQYSLSNLNNQLGYISLIFVVVSFIPVIIIDSIQERHPETTFLEKFNKWHIALRWSLMAIVFIMIIWFGYYGSGLPHFEFGYVQF